MSICGYVNEQHWGRVMGSFLATFPRGNIDKNMIKVLDNGDIFLGIKEMTYLYHTYVL